MKATEAKLITDNKAKERGTYVSYESVIEKIKATLERRGASYRCAVSGQLTSDVEAKLVDDGYKIGYSSDTGTIIISWL